MPRKRSPPRLYLDPKRQQWVIRDGSSFVRTGASEEQREQANQCLAQYIGHKYKPEPSSAPLIADVLSVYADEVAPHKKSARIVGYCINHLLPWWGAKNVADISAKTCRAYANGKPQMQALADIKILKAAVDYWHREYGPLNFIPVFWKPRENAPKERWLTKTEAAKLLNAARPYQHLRRAILLQLYTGSRPGVILALRWDQVDLKAGILHRLPRGSAQDDKKRSPPVRLGRRITAHLKRWRRLDAPDIGHVCHYAGRAVSDPHLAWDNALETSGLTGTGVSRHTLRHTRATWMANAGVPVWEAAGFLGMTPATFTRVYGHHHTDFQERAANI
jgi:integrase